MEKKFPNLIATVLEQLFAADLKMFLFDNYVYLGILKDYGCIEVIVTVNQSVSYVRENYELG